MHAGRGRRFSMHVLDPIADKTSVIPREFGRPKTLANCDGRDCGVITSEGRDQNVLGEATEL